MFFISNPNLRKLEAFMQEIPNFPPKGVKVDLDRLEDEILLFEVENVIVNLKQRKEKEKIMKFRNDQHRSTFLKEAKNQSLKNHKLIYRENGSAHGKSNSRLRRYVQRFSADFRYKREYYGYQYKNGKNTEYYCFRFCGGTDERGG